MPEVIVADLSQPHPEHEGDDLPVRRPEPTSRSPLWIMRAVWLAVMLTPFLCIGVGATLAMIASQAAKARHDKLIGSWKGGLTANTPVAYTFQRDGNSEIATFNNKGELIRTSKGRWQFASETIEITSIAGAYERATVQWVDDDTLRYQIINYPQMVHVGKIITLRRQ
jgi:hypothetical protein